MIHITKMMSETGFQIFCITAFKFNIKILKLSYQEILVYLNSMLEANKQIFQQINIKGNAQYMYHIHYHYISVF